MKCARCNNETVGTYNEGGLLTAVCAQCDYEEKQMMAGEDLDLDDSDDEDEENDAPDYYYCNGCFKDFARKPIWNECPQCGAIIEEGYY